MEVRMSDSDGEDGASYNDPTVLRFDEPVNVKDGEALLVDVKDGKVLARAVPSFQLGGPNPSPCSFEGCGKPATVYDRDRHPFIWCDDHDPTDYVDDVDPEVEARIDAKLDRLADLLSGGATVPTSDVIGALDRPAIDPVAEGFHEEPEDEDVPEWLRKLQRAGSVCPDTAPVDLRRLIPYRTGKRGQFLIIPAENDKARDELFNFPGSYPVDLLSEDGADDSVGWVYRVREPARVDTALSDKAAKAAQVTAAEIERGIETVAGFKAKLAAAKAAKRAAARHDDGITTSVHPGRFTFSDSIEADGDLTLDVDVECFIEASPYGATFEEPAGCDLEAHDFVATLDGVKLSPGVVEDMAKAGDWPTRAVEQFMEAGNDRVQPGIYQDTRPGGARWQVLGHLREPGEAVGGWVVCRPVSAYGLPLSEHGTPRGGWRLADSTPWDDESMAPEVPKAGPGVLRMAGAVDAPDPLTQAGPWATMNRLMALASSKRRIMDGDDEEGDRTEALREARDLAYEQAARENALQDVEAGRPVLMSYQVKRLLEACREDDTGLRAAIAALGPGFALDASTEAGYLVRLTDAETHEIHRLLDRVETRTGQPGGIRWIENLRGKLSRRRP